MLAESEVTFYRDSQEIHICREHESLVITPMTAVSER